MKEKEKVKVTSITMKPSQRKAVEELAQKEHSNSSQIVRKAVDLYLKSKNK